MTPTAETLLNIGIALTKEKNVDKLIELIIDSMMDLMNCDGGTLYLLEDNELHFKIMITKSLDFRRAVGEAEGMPPPMRLKRENVCSRAALDKTLINIEDVYESREFDFAGARKVDSLTGYRTKSMLTVPMEDDHGDVIGVLQLINALDDDGRVIAFAKEYERVLFSIASQAAICLTNRKYAADVVGLLDSFVFAMSAAVDARSPYTANHSRNMEKYAKRFIAWINESGKGVFFSPEKEREFLMSILLHDIGKLVVPTKVMDKNSRLCTKLGEILSRFQAFHMQAEINHLRGLTDYESYKKQITEIENAQELIEKANNIGFIDDEMMEELRALGSKTAIGPNGEEFFITPEEQTGLTVRKGTLTDAERAIIESHASMTNRILSEVRFPKNYRMVAEWASSHHEHLNGGGYPNKLAGDEISTEVRILTIIDVYEALTAHDRPYKPAMPAQRAFAILDDMAAQGQVDAELLAMFKESGAWEI